MKRTKNNIARAMQHIELLGLLLRHVSLYTFCTAIIPINGPGIRLGHGVGDYRCAGGILRQHSGDVADDGGGLGFCLVVCGSRLQQLKESGDGVGRRLRVLR